MSTTAKSRSTKAYPSRSRLEKIQRWSGSPAPHAAALGILLLFAGGGTALTKFDPWYHITAYLAGGTLAAFGTAGILLDRYAARKITEIYETLDSSQPAKVTDIMRVRIEGLNLAGEVISVEINVPAGRSLSVGDPVYL